LDHDTRTIVVLTLIGENRMLMLKMLKNEDGDAVARERALSGGLPSTRQRSLGC